MKIDSVLIERVLNNNASAAEAEAVAEWLGTEEGATYLSRQMMDESSSLTDSQTEEWIDHYVELKAMEQRMVTKIKRQLRKQRYWIVAAVLVPILVFGSLSLFLAQRAGFFARDDQAMEVVTACGEQMRVVLQDGTTVHLNAGSRLVYPRTFSLFERTVKLDGEAFVMVKSDRTRPFYVELSDTKVKVTGTTFNVKAYSIDSFVRITLTEGSVILIESENKSYGLQPGQQAEFDRNTRSCNIVKAEEPAAAMVWRIKGLDFYRTPLQDVLRTMERQYGTTFIVNDKSVLEYRFTYAGEKMAQEEVLRELEEVSRVRFVKREDSVYEVKMEEN